MKSEYVLAMTGISKMFPGVRALDNAQLKVHAGTVHALVGENGAGKSTLMKCLFGIYKKDAGEILLDGAPVEFTGPYEALRSGVSMVHQELNQVSQRSVMENIWLGRFPMKGIIVDEARMYRDTKDIFARMHIDIDPRKKIGELSVSQRQMVEIAKAVSYNARVLVLDEPTSSLTETEVGHLFNIITGLKEDGCAIIYISHKMEEVFHISDEITVMRDGRWIATKNTADLDGDSIVSLMVGRDLSLRFPQKRNHPSPQVVLEVKNLYGLYQPTVKDVSFQLHRGEILGIAGLVGARRTELVETIFGIRTRKSGEILLEGRPVANATPAESIRNGFALITEERRATGIFPQLSITHNAIAANLNAYASKRVGILDEARIRRDAESVVQDLKVKAPSQKTQIGNLSGGNQQKVILGRWLLTDSAIIMLDEPTRGIDVVSKMEIYQLMIDLAEKGKSILFISSEMPELLGVSDRILVMSNGYVAGIVDTGATTQEEILNLAARFL